MGTARLLHLTGCVGRRCCAVPVGTTRREVCREALGPQDNTAEGDVAIDEEDGIGRVVVAVSKATSMSGIEATHMARRAEDVVPESVSAEENLLEVIKDEFGRVVLVAAYLFEDDAALLLHLVYYLPYLQFFEIFSS